MGKAPTTLYIVRHGNTFDPGETVLRVGGRTDLPLSRSGQAQAQALGQHLSGVRFDRARVSPLRRTRMTADAILGAHPSPPKIEPTESLIEIDYGPDEGQPETDVIKRLGQDALTAWDQHATVPKDWHVDPDRIRVGWRAILDSANGTELIVTSNGVARFLLDLAAHDGVDRKLKTGAYGVLERRGGDWQITTWNVRP
jgi:probable phosphoglycerate mutase